MKITSNNIIDNYMDPKFGNNTHEGLVNGMVKKSFHLQWDNLPEHTKSLAIVFDDHDAVEVVGFTWIHWLVANIDPKMNQLLENASLDSKDEFIQGMNSWSSGLLPIEAQDYNPGFGGCAPPNKDHEYSIKVFALDTVLNLKNGFRINDLRKAMRNHILDSTELNFIYKQVIG